MISLFECNPHTGRGSAPRRKTPAARPRVEALDGRMLLTTGFPFAINPVSPLAQYYNNLQVVAFQQPVLFPPPSLVGHHVGLTGPGGALQGTVTFTSQNGTNFQGTYQSAESFTVQVPGPLPDSYTSHLNIGAIPISGTLTFAGSSGGVTSWAISLSGMGSGQGSEERDFTYLNPDNPTDMRTGLRQTETWNMVPITQSVSFSGTLAVSATATTVSGTFNEQDRGQWHWSGDHMLPGDPNHMEFIAETEPDGTTLDSSITKTVPIIQLQ
jgi:hypothetical protein